MHSETIISQNNPYISLALPKAIGALLSAGISIYVFFNVLIPTIQKKVCFPANFLTMRAIVFVIAVLIVILLFYAFFNFSTTQHMPASKDIGRKPNVILITMDTTRKDHLSCYGYQEKTTPRLDQLARESIVFENAYSTSSWTLPAHASLFTGLYPSQHGAHVREGFWGPKALHDQNITLAEILAHHGYVTAGFIGGYFCSSFFGMAQGFDYYHESLFNLIHECNNFFVTRIYRSLFPVEDIFEQHGLAGKK